MAFAFSTADLVLSPIDEEYDETKEEETTVEDVQNAKLQTQMLAAAAEKEMMELCDLLGKLKTGTATREEKDHAMSLHAKLDVMKKDMADSKTRESKTEIKMLHSVTRKKTAEVALAIKEKDIRSAIRAVCSAESVDLAFVVDSTGSMSPYIESVEASIRDIIRRIWATNGNLNLRLAMIAYRDVGDSNRFEVLDFVSSVDVFTTFLNKIRAVGGADAPEDIAGAIQQANRLGWSQPSRVTFLIADAPCHGREFHSYDDDYPSGTPGIDILQELKLLSKKCGGGSMTVTFGRILHSTDNMLKRFQESGIEITVVGIEDVGDVTKVVTKSVRKSIFKTMTVTGGGGKSVAFAPLPDVDALLKGSAGVSRASASLKDYVIVPKTLSPEDWKKHSAAPVKVYRNRRIKSIKDLQEPIAIGLLEHIAEWVIEAARPRHTDGTKTSTMLMRRSDHPFDEGEIRLAYHGQLARKKGDLDNDKSSVVMKSFKHVGKGLNDRSQYLKQMEVSTIAHFLGEQFNEFRPSRCGRIFVLQVCVVEEEDESKEASGSRRFCTEEPLPQGSSAFTKFSNNTGYWDEDHLHETLLRFTEYTYTVTRGYLMVTDLQGVRKGHDFYLTDPAILCKDILRFGHTNLGEKFMEKCIQSTRAYMAENGWR
jgi:hypothetical protein